MSEDFKQTVDLKEKMQAQNNLPATKKPVKKNISSRPVKTKTQKSLTEGHDVDRSIISVNAGDLKWQPSFTFFLNSNSSLTLTILS